MRCLLLTGDDDLAIRARRAALLTDTDVAADAVERFDLAVDGGAALVAAAGAMSLFGGPRLLEAHPAAALTEDAATKLAAVAALSDATVVLYGPAPTPKVKAALGDVAQGEAYPLPRTAGAQGARIAGLAAEHGIALDSTGRAMMLERAGHDIPRAASVLAQCALLGLTHPSPAQLDTLLGSSHAPGVPWALTDAVEAGDLATALTLCDSLDPVAAVSYLGSRTGQLGRIVEDGLGTPEEAASAFGLHTYPAGKLIALASRLGRRGVAHSWDIISGADRAVKSSTGSRAALEITVCELTALWSTGSVPTARP